MGLRGWWWWLGWWGGYLSNPALRNRKGTIQQNLGAERVRQGRGGEKAKKKDGKKEREKEKKKAVSEAFFLNVKVVFTALPPCVEQKN